jgi:hypothetical protein
MGGLILAGSMARQEGILDHHTRRQWYFLDTKRPPNMQRKWIVIYMFALCYMQLHSYLMRPEKHSLYLFHFRPYRRFL